MPRRRHAAPLDPGTAGAHTIAHAVHALAVSRSCSSSSLTLTAAGIPPALDEHLERPRILQRRLPAPAGCPLRRDRPAPARHLARPTRRGSGRTWRRPSPARGARHHPTPPALRRKPDRARRSLTGGPQGPHRSRSRSALRRASMRMHTAGFWPLLLLSLGSCLPGPAQAQDVDAVRQELDRGPPPARLDPRAVRAAPA